MMRTVAPATIAVRIPAMTKPVSGANRKSAGAIHHAGSHGLARTDRRTGRSARNSATREVSNASSNRSGERSTLAMRSTVGSQDASSRGSVSSNIVHLREQFLEPSAGTFHSHLQRGDAVARDLGHFFVAQLFDMLHEKRLALPRVEVIQRPLHFLELVDCGRRRGERVECC